MKCSTYTQSQLKICFFTIFLSFLNFKVTNVWADVSTKTLPVVKLSPHVIATPKEKALNFEIFKSYIDDSQILPAEVFNHLPYVVSMVEEERFVSWKGASIYVVGQDFKENDHWQIVRKYKHYFDPLTQKSLGVLARAVGEARVSQEGHPATLKVLDSKIEIRIGDSLIPMPVKLHPNDISMYQPRSLINAQIIDILGDGMKEMGRFQSVVLDKGMEDGLKSGALLTVYQPVKRIPDKMSDPKKKLFIDLPSKAVGKLLVYRVFPKTSLGLILSSTLPINIFYPVSSCNDNPF